MQCFSAPKYPTIPNRRVRCLNRTVVKLLVILQFIAKTQHFIKDRCGHRPLRMGFSARRARGRSKTCVCYGPLHFMFNQIKTISSFSQQFDRQSSNSCVNYCQNPLLSDDRPAALSENEPFQLMPQIHHILCHQ